MNYSVMVVDSHTIVLEGILSLFQNDPDCTVIAGTSAGKDCLQTIRTTTPDIIITDINLSDMDGLELFSLVKNVNPRIKVCILTEDDRPSNLLKAYDQNIEGYINKNVSFNDLKEAIKTIMEGSQYIEPSLIPYLNKNLLERDTHEELLKKLTRRETQMLKCVTNGLSNKEIAAECHISERTVKNHLSSVFQKIEVADRTQAAVFAIKTNLVKI